MQNQTPSTSTVEALENNRIEAFSDGVAAIAITLLVIELKVPHIDEAHPDLLDALFNQWPSYVAYFVSFWSVGLAWSIHHNMFKLIKRFSHTLLIVNALFLMFVALVPYPTTIVAEYLGNPSVHRTALLMYSVVWLMMAVMINSLWWTARVSGLLADGLDDRTLRRITIRYFLGLPLYLLALVLSLVRLEATLLVYVIVSVYYTLPGPDSACLEARR